MGFDWSLFLLDHDRPALFVTSEWQADKTRISPLYVCYRALMFLLMWAGLIGYIATLPYDTTFFPIFLTHWGFTLIVIFETADLALLLWSLATKSSYEEFDSGGEGPSIGLLHRLSWVLSNISFAAAPFISLFYWIVLYDPATNGEATFWNILVHGLNSVVAYIELFVCARPWRWHHLYQPSILGLIYVLFSIIYYAAGGRGKDGDPYIYKVLDWSNAGTASLVSFGAVAAVAVLHVLNSGLAYLRAKAASACQERGSGRVGSAE